MRLYRNPVSIPLNFHRHPAARGRVIHEADVTMTRRGRIAAKILIFADVRGMLVFWKQAFGHELGKGCLGAVNALHYEKRIVRPRGDDRPDIVRHFVHPKYFCVIGLSRGNLSPEIIAHEAVHAAYAYQKRVRRNLWGAIGDFDEEQIAYPAGRITCALTGYLKSKGEIK